MNLSKLNLNTFFFGKMKTQKLHYTHLLSSNGCRAVRFEQTAKFSLLRLLMIRGLLSKHSWWKRKEMQMLQKCRSEETKKTKQMRESQTAVLPHRGTWTCPCGAAAVWWRWAPVSLCCPADQTAALGSAHPSSPGSTHQSPPGSKQRYSSLHTGTPGAPVPLREPGRENVNTLFCHVLTPYGCWGYLPNWFPLLQHAFKYFIHNIYVPLQSTNAPRKLLRAGRGRILFQVGSSVFLRRHSSTSLLQRCAASGWYL